MEDKKIVIPGGAYVPPKLQQNQIKIVLVDIEGTEFEAVFNIPTTLELLEKNDNSVKPIPCPDDEEKYIFKYEKAKEAEWIFENLLVVPSSEVLKPEHLSLKSLKEVLALFPSN